MLSGGPPSSKILLSSSNWPCKSPVECINGAILFYINDNCIRILPQMFIGTETSNSIGWSRKICLTIRHNSITSCSASGNVDDSNNLSIMVFILTTIDFDFVQLNMPTAIEFKRDCNALKILYNKCNHYLS